jgi:AcrR family transcriptional regulator
MPKKPRSYASPTRDAAAADTRARVLEAAAHILQNGETLADFSLDAVARAAQVTRVTVYNQFGSRRRLLEAVFDQRASIGGLMRIPEVMASDNPREALHRLIEIFCDFWIAEPAAGRVHAEAGLDPDFAQSIFERNERRRKALKVLVTKIAAGKKLHTLQLKEVVDLLFVLTSYGVFDALRAGRTNEAVQPMVVAACEAILKTAGL